MSAISLMYAIKMIWHNTLLFRLTATFWASVVWTLESFVMVSLVCDDTSFKDLYWKGCSYSNQTSTHKAKGDSHTSLSSSRNVYPRGGVSRPGTYLVDTPRSWIPGQAAVPFSLLVSTTRLRTYTRTYVRMRYAAQRRHRQSSSHAPCGIRSSS